MAISQVFNLSTKRRDRNVSKSFFGMSPILAVSSQTRSARVKTGVEEMSSCRHNDTTKAA